MSALPDGVVTFLLTDIEDSSRLVEGRMDDVFKRHDALVKAASTEAHGHVLSDLGDGFLFAFERPLDALNAALAMQHCIREEQWNGIEELRVRMAIHSGLATPAGQTYKGQAPTRCSRLIDKAHGGQVFVSRAVVEILSDHLPDGIGFRDLGPHPLKGLRRPEQIFQVVADGLPDVITPIDEPLPSTAAASEPAFSLLTWLDDRRREVTDGYKKLVDAWNKLPNPRSNDELNAAAASYKESQTDLMEALRTSPYDDTKLNRFEEHWCTYMDFVRTVHRLAVQDHHRGQLARLREYMQWQELDGNLEKRIKTDIVSQLQLAPIRKGIQKCGWSSFNHLK